MSSAQYVIARVFFTSLSAQSPEPRRPSDHPPDGVVDVLLRDDHVVQPPLVAGLHRAALDVRQQLGAHVHVHGPVPAPLVHHVQRDVVVEVIERLREVRPHARLVHQVHQRAVDRLEVDAGRPYRRQPVGRDGQDTRAACVMTWRR